MNIPQVQLSRFNQNAVSRIIKSTKKPLPINEQMKMANYYAYLHSQKANDNISYAKLLLGK